jgi:RNA polymerase sigma-70 factor, ECF subfamily
MKEFAGDPDAGLMLRAGKGDRQAFEQIVLKYQKSIINTAYRYTGNPSIAEDLAQEVFVRVYRAASSYKPSARFSTWLFTIARNTCSNYRQREGRLDHRTNTEVDLSLTLREEESPESLLVRKQTELKVQDAVNQLPESLKTPLILNQFNQMSYDEIAKVMKISLTAVKVRIHRAKQTLADRLLRPAKPEENARSVTERPLRGLK